VGIARRCLNRLSIARRLYLKGKRFNCVAAFVSSNQKFKQNDQDRRRLLQKILLLLLQMDNAHVMNTTSLTFQLLALSPPRESLNLVKESLSIKCIISTSASWNIVKICSGTCSKSLGFEEVFDEKYLLQIFWLELLGH
jgi:hypothetical protein